MSKPSAIEWLWSFWVRLRLFGDKLFSHQATCEIGLLSRQYLQPLGRSWSPQLLAMKKIQCIVQATNNFYQLQGGNGLILFQCDWAIIGVWKNTHSDTTMSGVLLCKILANHWEQPLGSVSSPKTLWHIKGPATQPPTMRLLGNKLCNH